MTKKIMENDDGKFEWIATSEGSGFWSKIEESWLKELRTPERCPSCGEGMDLFSINTFYHRNGTCADCSIQFLDERKDGKWQLRFPEGHFKTRNDKVIYCREKIAAKKEKQ